MDTIARSRIKNSRPFVSETVMHAFEVDFVRAFITRHRQDRWLEFLASKDRRGRFLDRLNHCRDFDDRFVTLVKLSDVELVSALVKQGAPRSCYVLSDDDSLDAQEMLLADAVAGASSSGWGTIVICIPDRLAYYYDECGERRMILNRPMEKQSAAGS